MKKYLKVIREFFWPLLDRVNDDKTENIKSIELRINSVNLSKALDLEFKISQSENERRNSIESKASSFISTISITTSLVVASNTFTIGNSEYQIAIQCFVTLSFILTLYTVRTVWFSVKALARKGYHVIDINDINISGGEDDYYRSMILRLSKYTQNNEPIINEKVDNLVLAQEYYKRAIVIICIYALSVLIFCLFGKIKPKVEKEFKPKYVITSSTTTPATSP
ncbi:hypothetical protein [Mucilaginibacter myungsuensis]|uniref:Uncharacterized protein n=1 Tax=Mucilaginibacter myungsuensis TaxID=649104 RepID=A0A929PWT7_9SPHI|nr:hypothetical protein [Mucilaginibacter myungsuensis]MBE9661522.1 hypothetical protein [Mucilaginibacter myungsuensis]MDN3597665.1 hypothetical protein [Mucilaginibacter myungsuensis]